MNEENLKPFTSDQSRDKAVSNGAKGGIASGQARRKKADIRKAVQNILNDEYTTKTGSTITGIDALALNMYKIACDPKNRNSIQAAKMLLEIYGQDKSPLEQRKLKAEIKMLEAQVKKMTDTSENPAYGMLDDILKGLGEIANATIQPETE